MRMRWWRRGAVDRVGTIRLARGPARGEHRSCDQPHDQQHDDQHHHVRHASPPATCAPGRGRSLSDPPRPAARTNESAALPLRVALLDEGGGALLGRSEEHTSELQSLMRSSYAVFCLKKKKNHKIQTYTT